MENKRARGRPPKGEATQASRIYLRAQEAEKERYEKAAQKSGVPLTDWVKDRLNRAAKRELGD